MHRPHFTPQENSWYSFILEADSNPGLSLWLEGLGQLKKMVSSGTEPATFQLEA
jgi:hypothetical protein